MNEFLFKNATGEEVKELQNIIVRDNEIKAEIYSRVVLQWAGRDKEAPPDFNYAKEMLKICQQNIKNMKQKA